MSRRSGKSGKKNAGTTPGGKRGGGRRGGPGHSDAHRGKKFRRRSEKKALRSGALSEVLVGKVNKHQRGFAFLVPTTTGFPDAYLGAHDAHSLFDGDIVEFQVQAGADGRSSAVVRKVIKRAQQSVVGQLERAGKSLGIRLDRGPRLSIDTSESSRSLKEGDWVSAKITRYPEQTRTGEARITKNLGSQLGPEQDLDLAVARYNLPRDFSPLALQDAEQAARLGKEETDRPAPKRVDLRDKALVTIDGEDAKDFDDAVYVETKDFGFRLWVGIADVSQFVRLNSPLDLEAKARGTSVYFPGTCIPMLPEILSNDLCSLRPREPRLAMVAEMDFDPKGKSIASRFYSAIIQTAMRLTYTQVEGFLNKDAKITAELESLRVPLENLYKLYQRLDEQRKERGVLDFDLPEAKIQCDSSGNPTSILQAPRLVAHKIIEECMVAANREVAKALKKQGASALYRVHEPPAPEKIDDLIALLRTLGISAKVEGTGPEAFAAVLESTADHPAASTLHHAILRLQKQAKYHPDPQGHFGLALADYAHFTSPIRRYPDLVVHRALKGICGLGPEGSSTKEGRLYAAGTPEEMIQLGEVTSDAERRAVEAERFVVRRKACWFMERRLGDRFDARVTGVNENGLFVSIPWMAIEGFIPLDWMNGHWTIDMDRKLARKRPGHGVLRMGDAIRVELVKVSVDDAQITFAAIDAPPQKVAPDGGAKTDDKTDMDDGVRISS